MSHRENPKHHLHKGDPDSDLHDAKHHSQKTHQHGKHTTEHARQDRQQQQQQQQQQQHHRNRGAPPVNATALPPRQREPERMPASDDDTSPTLAKAAPPEPTRPLPRAVAPYVVGREPELEEGIRRGTHVVAALKVQKWTNGLAFGAAPGWLPRDVALHGFEARGAALPDDIVVIELDPAIAWKQVRSNVVGPEKGYTPVGFGNKSREVDLNALGAATAVVVDSDIGDAAAEAPAASVVRDAAFEQKVHHVLDEGRAAVQPKPAVRISTACGATPPTTWNTALQPTGKVVAVLERRFHEFQACRLFGFNGEGPCRVYRDKFYKFKPYDEELPLLTVMGTDIPESFRDDAREYLLLLEVPLRADNIGVEILGGMPRARVVMSLGKSGTADAESRAISAMYQIRDFPFSEEVEACVVPNFTIPTREELKSMGRRDLREEEFVCTIDPATARDLDDALSIARIPGGYRVGVHIADVSYFVPIDTPLDHEARQRCTSTYFVERVVPMLPHKLSEDYCSLNAGTDKFAFSCLFFFDSSGILTSEWFGQSVIRNRCRMAYGDAQRIIDGDVSGDSLVFHENELAACPREALVKDVVSSVQLLYELAQKLRARRYQKGALSLNKRKLRFWFEDMNSRVAPKGFALDSTQEANWLIEEYMLYANIRTATKVVEFLPKCALLRRHDQPVPAKMKEFMKAAKKHGFDISGRGSKALNDSLDRYKDHANSDALRLMATYCMSLAKYTCSGDDAQQPVGHYALATPLYTHFTSPIRRYCDLVVHRQLLLALEIEQLVKAGKAVCIDELRYAAYYLHPADCQDICDNANDRKEASRKAGEESMKMFFCLYLDALRLKSTVDAGVAPRQRCKAIVTRVKDDRFSVYCPQIALDGEIFHNSKKQRWVSDNTMDEEEGDSFTIHWGLHQGTEVNEKAGLFTEVDVTLEVVVFGTLRLEMIVHPPWERRSDSAVLDRIPSQL